jgi:hypothetical protein
MRISADPNHPDYNPLSARAEVFLDGSRLSHCVTADSDAGTAECHRIDKNGHVMHRDGEILMETKRGNICIVVPE